MNRNPRRCTVWMYRGRLKSPRGPCEDRDAARQGGVAHDRVPPDRGEQLLLVISPPGTRPSAGGLRNARGVSSSRRARTTPTRSPPRCERLGSSGRVDSFRAAVARTDEVSSTLMLYLEEIVCRSRIVRTDTTILIVERAVLACLSSDRWSQETRCFIQNLLLRSAPISVARRPSAGWNAISSLARQIPRPAPGVERACHSVALHSLCPPWLPYTETIPPPCRAQPTTRDSFAWLATC